MKLDSINMSVACMTTPEQKKSIFKNYYSILTNVGGYNQKVDNYESKPNCYLSHIDSKISQTSRTKEEDDFWSENSRGYVKYFVWVDYETFVSMLNKILMRNAKIKF